jgi:hypothetical protein
MRLSLSVANAGSRLREGVGFGIALLAMLLGEQLFLFLQQPELRVLIGDWPSMGRLVSASVVQNVLFAFLILSDFDRLSSPRAIYDRFRINRPLGVQTAIGVVILCAPFVLLFLALSDGSLRTALLVACVLLIRLMAAFARMRHMPRVAIHAAAGFLFGLCSSLLLGEYVQKAFACGSDIVELRSGDILACKGLIRMESRGLWLVEGPVPPRLIKDRDFLIIQTAER